MGGGVCHGKSILSLKRGNLQGGGPPYTSFHPKKRENLPEGKRPSITEKKCLCRGEERGLEKGQLGGGGLPV